MNKKAIAILGAIFILIVGTLGFLIYSKYSGSKTATPPPIVQPPPVNTTNATPPPQNNLASTTPAQTNPPGAVLLTSDQVISPALFFNGQGLSYFDHQGNLYQASLQNNNGQLSLGDKKQLVIPVKAGITKILWPSRGNDFIARLTDVTGNTIWSYFNSSLGVYIDLPPSVESVDWMPTGDKIVFVWVDNGKGILEVGSPDTKTWQKIGDMYQTDNTVSVSSDGTQVLFYETANPAVNNAINSVSIDGKVWKGLVKNGQNLGVLWSPDGQKFLFGKKDPITQKYQLWVYNLTSGEIKGLGLYTTVSKVTWDKDSNVIYAAVPDTGVPGDNSLTVDSFYRLDTSTLDKKHYPSNPGISLDGRDLFLNATSDKLFFRNAQDGGMYYLDLTQ